MIHLHIIDWFIILWYLLISLGVGLYFTRRASKKIDDYFVAGRSLPWWIAGTSMVATTFGADTPLAVTGLTAQYGIAGNWFWWSYIFGGVLTAVFYAKLWRRSGVITDVEFTEMRYSGKPAATLRCFRAIHTGVFVNALIMSWPLMAMSKIFQIFLGWPKVEATIIVAVIALIYTVLAGIWGITMTDVIQFVVAMVGAFALAILAINYVGGISGLYTGLVNIHGVERARDMLRFIPTAKSAFLSLPIFLTYIGLNWYASWYPGAEPGGGGYVAQRMLSCKTEKDSTLSVIWFTFAHYNIRTWPWVIVALVSIVVWPGLADPELGYPMAIELLMPTGLLGLIVVAFLAAFMSTMDTHINWGASYIVRDVYQRFIKKDADAKHYVTVARISSVFVLILAILFSFVFKQISQAWMFLVVIGAGTGLVYLLRWFWWRINAWSEISAMCAAVVVGLTTQFLTSNWVTQMWVTFLTVTTVWLTITFLTRPEKNEVLDAFYEKIKPNGFWGPVAKRTGIPIEKGAMMRSWITWICGCAFIIACLVGTGFIILGSFKIGIPFLILTVISFVGLYFYIIREKHLKFKNLKIF
jgi:SSS family transporter